MAVLKYWDGAAWQTYSAGPGVEVYYQPTPPATNTIGAIWIDTDEGAPVNVVAKIAQAYTVTAGYTADRTVNPVATSVGELAAVVATLIDDMKTAGLINP